MSTSISDDDIRRGWGHLQRVAKSDPGVAYLDYRTGQLVVHFDSSERDVDRVFLKAVATPGIGDDPILYYHAIVHRTTADDEAAKRRELFRHPMPALDWIHETVTDFDLLDTVTLNEPEPDSTGDANSTPADR